MHWHSSKKISFSALMLLIISAIDSNRNLPSSALFGAPLVFFFLFAALFFLFPTALVAAELSAHFPEEGGIYHWIRQAFGEKIGMLAIWLQWINTVVWYPTVLSFLAATLGYLYDPSLLDNRVYLFLAISLIFWGLTCINLFGVYVSTQINTFFACIGTLLPMLFLIALAAVWIGKGEPLQISVSLQTILPQLEKLDTWTALQAVIGSFVGMELSGVHIAHVPHPQKTFPKALLFSSVYILLTMVCGSLAIAIVLPQNEINLTGGLMQVFARFFESFGLKHWTFPISLLIVIGCIGGMINWLLSPAKGLLQAAKQGFLPPFLLQTNRHAIPQRILFLQASFVTLLSLLLLSFPSVNGFYWFLTALSNSLYMLMYLLLFFSLFSIRKSAPPARFQIPGGRWGLQMVAGFGIIGASATLFFGFIPPPHLEVGSSIQYFCMIAGGNVLLISPLFLFYNYQKRNRSI